MIHGIAMLDAINFFSLHMIKILHEFAQTMKFNKIVRYIKWLCHAENKTLSVSS